MAYWKKIKNSDAVPVLKDELVFDETPTVNSTNPVTSDGIARAIAGASGEVPVVTEGDNGKILTAIYDEGGPAVEWAEAPSGLPDTTGASQGDVLSIGSTGPEWAALPSATVSTSGVISGDGSVADPVVLNVGAGLSSGSSTEWGESASISRLGYNGLALPASVVVDILTNNKNVQLTLPNDGGVWSIQDTQGGNYALALYYGADSSSWTPGVVFSPNYTDRWNNGSAYLSGFHGTKTVELDMSNLISNIDSTDSDAVRRAALLAYAQDNSEVLLAFARYFNDGQGYYRYYFPGQSDSNYISYTNMSYKLGVPGSAVLSVTHPVPAYAAGDAGKVLQVNAGGNGVQWAALSGGYTPVDLQTITAAPYNIPVGNRQDVAVTLTGYTLSDALTIQLSADCTDAVVKVNASPGGFSGIRVMRGSDTVTMFGGNDICHLTTNLFADAGRVVLSTNDPGGSGAEAPTSFAEMEVLPQADILGSVDYEDASSSHQTSFLVEIKGRNAIIHAL